MRDPLADAVPALTREMLRDGGLHRMVSAETDVRALTAAELAHSRNTLLARLEPGQDVWLFAYGSLLWNPTFEHVETRLARVSGWHRRFCLWTRLGRGTPEQPGLMLGLERGGSCGGVAYRVAASAIECELDLVWRREMVTGAYRPTWLRARTADGPVDAIAFTIEHGHKRYAGKLPEATVAAILAHACGPLGTGSDYLHRTAVTLAGLGIPDRRLDRLCDLVDAQLDGHGEHDGGRSRRRTTGISDGIDGISLPGPPPRRLRFRRAPLGRPAAEGR